MHLPPISENRAKVAISTSQFIHRKILTRLFLGWLFLSVTIGGFVLWLEINRIQHSVHELAISESVNFSRESAHNLEHMDISARQHLMALAQQLVNQHFLIVELYDHNKLLQLEMVRRGQELAEQEINSYRHRFPQQGEFSHEFHLIHNELLLVILVPLKDAQNSLIGYFEGIYLVDRQTLDVIRNDLLRTLLFVTLSITFTTFLMYPNYIDA